MSHIDWRLLITSADNGPMNMAIDQAIMEAVAQDSVPPTLRLYAWEPPCLSLGYTQPFNDVDLARLAASGWDVVRRMTGGRAILHTDELTYSVAVRANDPIVAGDIVESYRRLSQALLACLRRLGATAEADKLTAPHPNAKGPVCFEVPSHYEITVSGRKLVGSAQVRKFGAVLQHGSIPLTGDISRICEALVFESDSQRQKVRRRVHQRAATLEDVTGQTVSWDIAASTLAESFQEIFNLRFTVDRALTLGEQARAEVLYTEQYASDDWNRRF